MFRYSFNRKPKPQPEKQLRLWKRNYQILKAYAERTGRSVPPKGYKEGGLNLRNWVERQRQRRRDQRMPDDQIELLEVLPGWSWGRFIEELEMPTEVEPSYGGSEWNFIICGTEYRKMSVYEHLLPKPAMRRKTAIRSACRAVVGVDFDEERNLNPTGRTWFLVERALDALIREGKVDQPKKGMVRAVQPDPGQIMDVEWLFCIRKVRGRSKMTRSEVAKRALEVAKQYYGVQVEDGEVPSGLLEVVKNVAEGTRRSHSKSTR